MWSMPCSAAHAPAAAQLHRLALVEVDGSPNHRAEDRVAFSFVERDDLIDRVEADRVHVRICVGGRVSFQGRVGLTARLERVHRRAGIVTREIDGCRAAVRADVEHDGDVVDERQARVRLADQDRRCTTQRDAIVSAHSKSIGFPSSPSIVNFIDSSRPTRPAACDATAPGPGSARHHPPPGRRRERPR